MPAPPPVHPFVAFQLSGVWHTRAHTSYSTVHGPLSAGSSYPFGVTPNNSKATCGVSGIRTRPRRGYYCLSVTGWEYPSKLLDHALRGCGLSATSVSDDWHVPLCHRLRAIYRMTAAFCATTTPSMGMCSHACLPCFNLGNGDLAVIHPWTAPAAVQGLHRPREGRSHLWCHPQRLARARQERSAGAPSRPPDPA